MAREFEPGPGNIGFFVVCFFGAGSGKEGRVELSPEEFSSMLYAYVKLGAPDGVQEENRQSILRLLATMVNILGSGETFNGLSVTSLRQVLLSMVPPLSLCRANSSIHNGTILNIDNLN